MAGTDKGKRKKEDAGPSRRNQPKQSKPKPRGQVDCDSDPNDEDSYYDPAAKPLERDLGFSIPTRRMLRNLQALMDRKIENTRMVCMTTLETFGVAADFRRLTSRIGFKERFWNFKLKTYRRPTLEFLSSLVIKFNEEDEKNYLKFRLSDETHRLNVEELGTMMGFDDDYYDEPVGYRGDWDKLDFWKLITGLDDHMRYKTRFIQHPVIRITQRILAQTFFARGESVLQLNDNEGHLLDIMLREDPVKPYLALLMAEHWIFMRNSGRKGGHVTMGAYVTLIARALSVDIDTSETCPAPCLMTTKWFSGVHFIEIEKEDGDIKYKWLMERRAAIDLPYMGPIDHRPSTWLIPVGYVPVNQEAGHGDNPVEEEGMQVDEEPQPEPQPPYVQNIPQEQPAWFTQFYNLSLTTSEDAREARRFGAQNAEGIARLNERVDAIENNQVEWAYRYDHGYWPSSEHAPSTYQ